jgi:hypothetical protein
MKWPSEVDFGAGAANKVSSNIGEIRKDYAERGRIRGRVDSNR